MATLDKQPSPKERTVLVVDVRCDHEEAKARIKRGSRAIIIDYDTTRLAYVIEPMEELLASEPADSGAENR